MLQHLFHYSLLEATLDLQKTPKWSIKTQQFWEHFIPLSSVTNYTVVRIHLEESAVCLIFQNDYDAQVSAGKAVGDKWKQEDKGTTLWTSVSLGGGQDDKNPQDWEKTIIPYWTTRGGIYKIAAITLPRLPSTVISTSKKLSRTNKNIYLCLKLNIEELTKKNCS